MKWFEYKAEMDALTAPDALKDRLRAMAASLPEDGPAPRKAEKWTLLRRFAKPAGYVAAGFALCIVAGSVLLGSMRAGSSFNIATAGGAASSTASYYTPSEAGSAGKYEGVYASNGVSDSNGYYGAYVAEDSFSFDYEAAEEPMAPVPAPAEAEVEVSGAMTDGGDGTRAESADAARQEAPVQRKIIYTATLRLESKEYDETLAGLQMALAQAGGYVQSSEGYNYGTGNRSVYMMLRVPAANYQSFLNSASGCGSLLQKTEDSQDITADYVDVAARISSLENQRARLQALEAKAETLTDLLEIENQLTNVQYQLESWQGTMRVYNDRVDYCTVHVNLNEVSVYTPVTPTLWERIENAFTGGLRNFGSSMEDLLLWVLRSLPWLVLIAVAIVIVVAVRRKRVRRK